MAELLVVQTLTEKRAEILGRIRAYEAQIAQAKRDLAHVNATIELFAAPERQRARYMVSHGFFTKGEIADICTSHLGVDGEMNKRQLAERVMARTRPRRFGYGVTQLCRVQGRLGPPPRQTPQARPDGRKA